MAPWSTAPKGLYLQFAVQVWNWLAPADEVDAGEIGARNETPRSSHTAGSDIENGRTCDDLGVHVHIDTGARHEPVPDYFHSFALRTVAWG